MSANLQVMQVLPQGYAADGAVEEGQPFVISAEYRNDSDHASGPFQVTFVLDGITHHAVDVHDCGPSESQWVQWQTDGVVAGTHHVRIGFAGLSHESEHVGEAYDQEFPVRAAAIGATAQDARDEADLANGYVNAERTVLQKWRDALNDFKSVLESATEQQAHPDFAGALLKVFEDKALGKLAEMTHAGMVFDALKAAVAEAERAKTAQVSVALRNFYHEHLVAVSALDAQLYDAQEHFASETRAKAAQLLADGDADGYLAFRAHLIALHDDAAARVHEPLEAYIDGLGVQWMNQSIKDLRTDVAIRIRILKSDLSVLSFKIEGPDGDKLTEHLGAQRGGVDLWALAAPRSIAYYNRDGEGPEGWVHIDAANRLIESPAEQGVSPGYESVYARLHAQGHLIAHGAG